MKVYLDPGHGGNDSGAVGVNGVLEKNIVLDVCKKVASILRNRGIDVKLSRNDDTFKTLSYRTTEANNWGANCLVSIHCNSATNTSAKGLETFCYKFKYRKLADCVHNEFVNDRLYTKNRGVKEGNLHMVRESKMSACLVELGFISNVDDTNLIEANKEKMALSISNGICKYLGVKCLDPNTSTSNNKMLAVCIGAYKDRANAEKALKEAKSKGFKDAYLIPR